MEKSGMRHFAVEVVPSNAGPVHVYTACADFKEGDQPNREFTKCLLEDLKSLCQLEDILRINLKAVPYIFESADHDVLCDYLAHLILKETCKEVLVPEKHFKITCGKVKHFIFQALKQSFGNGITLKGYPSPLQISHFFNYNRYLHKITTTAGLSDSVKETIKILNSIESIEVIPELNASVRYAFKYFSKLQRKIYVEEKADDSPCCNNSTPMEESINENVPKGIPSNTQNFKSKRTWKCYVCKAFYSLPKRKIKYTIARKQYPRMCSSCAELNLEKRNQKVNLKGKYAVVTGGRIKIGYELVLKMLRDGCFVIVTTRFPHDATKRFSQEKDFAEWENQVKIYPLDMKDLSGIHRFVHYVKITVPHLDILINNAAQTLRRPIDFYRDLLDYECIPHHHLKDNQQNLLATTEVLNYGYSKQSIPTQVHINTSEVSSQPKIEDITDQCNQESDGQPNESNKAVIYVADTANADGKSADCIEKSHIQSTGDQFSKVESSSRDNYEPPPKKQKMNNISSVPFQRSFSADASTSTSRNDYTFMQNTSQGLNMTAYSANPILGSNSMMGIQQNKSCLFSMTQYFPRGAVDEDGQQLDLRRHNSWMTVLDNVPIAELMEVLMINTVAPFILNKELKSLLKKSPSNRRFIINVSAMEGQFNREQKTRFHPHTNMAKAALNMMTRTAAIGYKQDQIYMTSVDTGWVTDERPLKMAKREQKIKGFKLPLDCIDGAARVYDPIVSGYSKENKPLSAVFIKDYKVYPW